MSTKKNVRKEMNVRMVGVELSSLLGMFTRMQGNGMPATEETKKKVADTIKDYCDTIVQFVDLF